MTNMNDFSLKIKRFLLIIGDLAVFYLSLFLALILRHGHDFELAIFKEHLPAYTIIYAVWLLVFYINHLYSINVARNDVKFYTRLLNTLIVNVVLAIIFFYFAPAIKISPKTVLFLDLGILIVLLTIWRQAFNYLIRSSRILSNTLIVGSNEASLKLAKEIINKPQIGYQLKAMVISQPLSEDMPNEVKLLNLEENLREIIKREKIKTVITALDYQQNPRLIQQLYRCLPLGVEFFDLPSFYEKVTGKIPINTIGQIWFLENFKEKEKLPYEALKRIVDIILSLGLGLISLPFIPFIILIIKLESQGPALFKQTRTGKNGSQFLAMKFRSMQIGAEKNGPQWAEKNDPRVTRFGKWLRKLRIDEIPQLINILRGEMSFIGPRPERPEFITLLEEKIPFYKERLLVKPGLTGWAQVMGPAYGGSVSETIDKLQFDLYYIKNRNLILDLSIILKTINIILKGGGR